MRFRFIHLLGGKPAILAFLTGLSALTGLSQDHADRWVRVITDEDSTIEVNRFSLLLEPDQIIRADFRTTFTNPVLLLGEPGRSYHTRLDSIQFRLYDKRYRIRETKFVDNDGRVLSSRSTDGPNVWKSAWGRTGSALFSAATQLRPFGTWKIVSYRYASGEKPSDNDPPELKLLLDSGMYLAFDHVRVADLNCDSPILEPKVMSRDEFSRRVGISLETIGIADSVNALYLRCHGRSTISSDILKVGRQATPILRSPSNRTLINERVATYFPTILMLRPSDDRMLMLWAGVFLELERTRNIFLPRSY